MSSRKTIQQELVKKAVSDLHCHATADEIYDKIKADFPSISKATVYRNLQSLSEIGEIKKVSVFDGADHYDHNTTPHFHAICEKCKAVCDVDFDPNSSVFKDLKNPTDSGFLIDGCNILFFGLCKNCRDGVNEKNNLF